MRSERNGKNKKMFYMHREVLGLKEGDQREVDHKEPLATTLNIFANLRIVAGNENYWNKRGWSKSGFKWANFHSLSGLYHSVISVNKVRYSLGYHRTAEQAHRKALALSKRLQGEYSRGDHRKRRT